MQAKALNEWMDKYEAFLTTRSATERLIYWESQQHFQEHWDFGETDLVAMLDQSLSNSKTKRLWKRENYEPKSALLELARYQKIIVFDLFSLLYDEQIDIEKRLEQVRHLLDELLQDYRDQHPRKMMNNHYHNGYEMISLYLAFRYPSNYVPYQLASFQRFLKATQARIIPTVDDPVRYFTLSRTLFKMLSKRPTLMQKHQNRLQKNGFPPDDDSILIAFDFIAFVGGWAL